MPPSSHPLCARLPLARIGLAASGLILGAFGGGGCTADSEAVRIERTLPGPLARGVDWQIDSAWHAAPLPRDRPERTLPPDDATTFEEAEPGSLPAAWLADEALAGMVAALSGRMAAAPPTLPRVVAEGGGRHLTFPAGQSVAVHVVPVAPLSPVVLQLRVRQPVAARGEPRVLLVDLREEPGPQARDGQALFERLQSGRLVTLVRFIGGDLAGHATLDARRILPVEKVTTDADGFEQWRVPFMTDWSSRALLVCILGSEPTGRAPHAAGAGPEDAVAVDDVLVHLLPARAVVADTTRDFLTANLPRPDHHLDATLRATKVRCDWETRRGLLLPRGAVARCELAAPAGGGRIELGCALVREERLTRQGPWNEAVSVTVTLRDGGKAGNGGAILHREQREVPLTLDFAQPRGWQDVSFALPRLPAGVLGVVGIELGVGGADDPRGALVAVSSPQLLPVRRTRPRNLVLISLDTLRADRLGKRRDGASLTPNLDRLAQRSFVFRQALANASYTLPSHVSLFTSQFPSEHSLFAHTDLYDPARSSSLAELLGRAGWLTAAFTSGGMLNAEFCGIDAGFDRWSEVDPMLSANDRLRRGAPLRDRPQYNAALQELGQLERSVLPWVAAHHDQPFFLFLHTYLVHNYQPEPELARRFDPHGPAGGCASPLVLGGPVPYVRQIAEIGAGQRRDERIEFTPGTAGPHEFVAARDLDHLERLYDATVFQADREVGRLLQELERLGLADDTIVVVTSDHGEEFLEHGDLSHARTLFDEIIRVPLILHVPGLAPQEIDDPVDLVDVAPTLLVLLGVEPDPRMRGRDLLAAEWSPRVTIHEGVERTGSHQQLRAARSSSAKLVLLIDGTVATAGAGASAEAISTLADLGYLAAGVPEGGFFDLLADPAEQRDLALDPDLLTPLQQSRMGELVRQLQRVGSPAAEPPR